MRRLASLVCPISVALILTSCSDSTAPVAPGPSSAAAATRSYVVLLHDSVVDPEDAIRSRLAEQRARLTGGTDRTIRTPLDAAEPEPLRALNAAVIRLATDEAEALARDPRVTAVEAVKPLELSASRTMATPSWALDRLDQAALPLNGQATRWTVTGTGVRILIFDTGIRWTHGEVRGRVIGGYNAFTNSAKVSGDVQGHGTFVASLAAGATLGTAPGASLVDVQVMNAQGSGSTLELTRATDWAIAEKRRVAGPMVVNMSLGVSGGSVVADSLVARLVANGITVVTAAGNAGANACTVSPARVPAAITVGATALGTTDLWASFSNGGSCVDLAAPGQAIRGAGMTGDQALVQGSGTSMAAPFVAGAAALYLSANSGATPATVSAWLQAESVSGAITGLPASTPNRLLALRREPTAAAPAPVTPAPAPAPAPTPTPAPAPSGGTMSAQSNCTGRTCVVNVTVPSGVSAAVAPRLVYTWSFGPGLRMTGTNLRQQTIVFGTTGTYPLTIEARDGTTLLATTSLTLRVQ